MALKLPPRTPRLPVMLRRLNTHEFAPVPHHPTNLPVIARLLAQGPEVAARLSIPLGDYWSSRRGTAAALHEIDQAWGGGFYNVTAEALLDSDAADAALGGNSVVIDVQTHYVSDRPLATRVIHDLMLDFAESVSADRFKGLGRLMRTQNLAGYSLAEYLRCVYMESETAVAVLSAGPGADEVDPSHNLNNAEMIGTRELTERLGGSGRLINHANVSPNVPGEMERMGQWNDWCAPAGWKCYTMYGDRGTGLSESKYRSWMFDDEVTGLPFLRRVRESGVNIVSVHKGLTCAGADTGWDGPSSPRDIGPAANAFPDINFLVYHSGYEPREGDEEEGPYSDEVAHKGTNRLVKSLKDAGIGAGGNVYAELGATWFLLMAHPREAAHVMGKLLAALGEDNILWGTDCIWFGPQQPLIDAFRAFQIPQEYSERYGYPQLTPTAKDKILGLNAARLYGIDPEQAKKTALSDELAWVKAAMDEYKAKGTPVKS